ncbi:MAG: Ni/Co efflux regulator RcnB, partial [Maricaulis maris]
MLKRGLIVETSNLPGREAMIRIVTLLSAVTLFAVPLAHAQNASSLHPVLETALTRPSITVDERDWRFIVTMTNEDGAMVGRFDGTR